MSGLNQRKYSGAGKEKKEKPEKKGSLPGCWGWVLKYVQESIRAPQVTLVVKNPPDSAGDKKHGFSPWVEKIPWRRK